MLKQTRFLIITLFISIIIIGKVLFDSFYSIYHIINVLKGIIPFSPEYMVSDITLCVFIWDMIVLAIWISTIETVKKSNK